MFFAFELPAKDVFGFAPWLSLSNTVSGIIKAWPPEGWLVAAFMVILMGHFEWDWSWHWLVAIAAVGLALYLGHLFLFL